MIDFLLAGRLAVHTFLTALSIDPTQEVSVEGQTIPLADPAGKAIRELLTA